MPNSDLQVRHSNVCRSFPSLLAGIQIIRIIASQLGQIGRSVIPSGTAIVVKGAILCLPKKGWPNTSPVMVFARVKIEII
jgi:hypothetical protein